MRRKILIILTVLIISIVGFFAYKIIVKKKYVTTLPDKVSINQGHREFPGAQWGLISNACEDGGFDILSYAGQGIEIRSSLAVGKFYKNGSLYIPVNINEIYSKNEEKICTYYSDSTGLIIPGLFSVNDSDIKGNK